MIVLVALGLPLIGLSRLDQPLPVPGPISIFAADLVVIAAIGSWVTMRLFFPHAQHGRPLRTPVLGFPLLVFALFLVPGLIRGHERYGASLLGQPVRLVAYAGLALAMTEVRPRDLYRGIVTVFYAGIAWQASLGVYYLVTNTSQTPVRDLSTGGARVLSLTTGMYLASGLVVALLNLERERRPRWRVLHLSAGCLALFGIALSFGRTTILALLLLIPLLLWQLPRLRGTLVQRWRWWVPVALAAVTAVAILAPNFRSTFVERVSANPLTDRSVRWRERRIEAALSGMKSGQWRALSESTPSIAAAQPNSLANGDFENGTGGWAVQGGSLSTSPSNNRDFGKHILQLSTVGAVPDEGAYSDPVPASKGEMWTFSVWLRGLAGNEHVKIGIWRYDDHNSGVGQTNFPVTLTATPTQYFVTTTITDSRTTQIRTLIRTQDEPERMTVYADFAQLNGGPRPRPDPAAGIFTRTSEGAGVASPVLEPVTGAWHPAVQPLSLGGGANQLANNDFELGATGWKVQGGSIALAPPKDPDFGRRSLRLRTKGAARDEGVFSEPVAAQDGQTWTFSVWLRAADKAQPAKVSIWQYDLRNRGAGQANLPVRLTTTPTQYVVSVRVANPKTTSIRALVRTVDRRKLDVYVDDASLILAGGPRTGTVRAQAGGSFNFKEPLLGLGFGRSVDYVWRGTFYRVEGDPDNSYVYLLAGGGILALTAFLSLMAVYARAAWRTFRTAAGIERALVAWALATWFLVVVNAAMAPFYPRPKIVLTLWAVLLLPAVVRRASTPGSRRRKDAGFEDVSA